MTPLLIAAALVSPVHAAELTGIEVDAGRQSHGVMTGIVDAPLPQVFAIVMDCEGTQDWFPDVEDTHLDSDGRCSGRTDLPWPLADRVWSIDLSSDGLDTDSWEAGFAYVPGSGNLVDMHGRYVLEAMDDGRTHVTYEAWVDLGFWVPEVLAAWATKRLLPGVLDGIESEAARDRIAAL